MYALINFNLKLNETVSAAATSAIYVSKLSFFLEISVITHSTEEKTRFGPEAAAGPVSNSMF